MLLVLRKANLLGSPVAASVATISYMALAALSLVSYTRFEVPARRWVVAVLEQVRLTPRPVAKNVS